MDWQGIRAAAVGIVAMSLGMWIIEQFGSIWFGCFVVFCGGAAFAWMTAWESMKFAVDNGFDIKKHLSGKNG